VGGKQQADKAKLTTALLCGNQRQNRKTIKKASIMTAGDTG